MLIHNNKNKRRLAIKQFDEKHEFKYIGAVGAAGDNLVRGFTTSTTYHDSNFSVGFSHGYNVSMVDRTDVVRLPDKSDIKAHWLIMMVELKTARDLPHFLINSNSHSKYYSKFFEIFPNLNPIIFDESTGYTSEFVQRFSVYAKPSNFLCVSGLVSVQLSRVLSAHFWPLSVEQIDGCLYIYYDGQKITPRLLEVLQNNGIWLANYIDNYAG